MSLFAPSSNLLALIAQRFPDLSTATILCYRDAIQVTADSSSGGAGGGASGGAAGVLPPPLPGHGTACLVAQVDMRSGVHSYDRGGADAGSTDTTQGWTVLGWQLNAKGAPGPDVVSLGCVWLLGTIAHAHLPMPS